MKTKLSISILSLFGFLACGDNPEKSLGGIPVTSQILKKLDGNHESISGRNISFTSKDRTSNEDSLIKVKTSFYFDRSGTIYQSVTSSNSGSYTVENPMTTALENFDRNQSFDLEHLCVLSRNLKVDRIEKIPSDEFPEEKLNYGLKSLKSRNPRAKYLVFRSTLGASVKGSYIDSPETEKAKELQKSLTNDIVQASCDEYAKTFAGFQSYYGYGSEDVNLVLDEVNENYFVVSETFSHSPSGTKEDAVLKFRDTVYFNAASELSKTTDFLTSLLPETASLQNLINQGGGEWKLQKSDDESLDIQFDSISGSYKLSFKDDQCSFKQNIPVHQPSLDLQKSIESAYFSGILLEVSDDFKENSTDSCNYYWKNTFNELGYIGFQIFQDSTGMKYYKLSLFDKNARIVHSKDSLYENESN